MKAKKDDAICDFCGAHQDFRLIMITRGSDRDIIHICDECVDKCADLVAEKRAEKLAKQKKAP